MQLLPEWDPGVMEVNAVFVSGKTIKSAVRAFADFLQSEFLSQTRDLTYEASAQS